MDRKVWFEVALVCLDDSKHDATRRQLELSFLQRLPKSFIALGVENENITDVFFPRTGTWTVD